MGNSEKAEDLLQASINILRRDPGSGCEQRAVIFLNKMRKGELPRCFTVEDNNAGDGVNMYIMEIPYAVAERRTEALKRRYDAMGAYFGSMARSYELQGQSQARMARAYARHKYQKATGNTFSPNDPPSRGTSARESWDRCKKIYDIFGD